MSSGPNQWRSTTYENQQKRQQDIDRLIEKLRVTKGEDVGVKHVVQSYLRQIDADAMMRIRELAAESGEAGSPEQALAYRNLADGVMKAMQEVSQGVSEWMTEWVKVGEWEGRTALKWFLTYFISIDTIQ